VLTQLNPPLPLETSKGPGWAHFVIDYGPEAALLWVVFMDADGACWTVPNFEVRMSFNWTGAAKTRRRNPGGAGCSCFPGCSGAFSAPGLKRRKSFAGAAGRPPPADPLLR
jgi:hypothetical protein